MKRTATGLGIAAAVACAVTLGAQTSTTTTSQRTSSTTDKANNVTVTGCLAREGSGFILNNARMDTTAGTSGSTAAGATTSGTASTTGTNASASMSNGPAMNWMLSGGDDLDKHVGHKIQVTGKTDWNASMSHTSTASAAGAGTTATSPNPTSTAGATGTTGSTEKGAEAHGAQPRLDVQSVKMIATSCS
jgi:hypothetical protein